jgi:hypothetical protein
MNNYDYSRVIFLVNVAHHLDNNFLLLKQDKSTASPIAVLYFEEYLNIPELLDEIHSKETDLQCVVSHEIPGLRTLPFGTAQFPGLMDYADNIDTMQFLIGLNKDRK